MNCRPLCIIAGPTIALAALLTGCSFTPPLAVFETGSALEVRSYQTRVLQAADRDTALRAVIATLQDLGFVLDSADTTLGTVTATKLAHYQIRMTVAVRQVDDQQVLVRANADYSEPLDGRSAVRIEDPATYQDFFQALERSAFLAAQNAE
jgi:peptidoglycan hydrolase-like protein with peptidoglycan-binding domain